MRCSLNQPITPSKDPMSNIIPFKRPAKKTQGAGNTLCRSGFHRFEIDHSVPFNVVKGKLVTIERCVRCGKTRHELR